MKVNTRKNSFRLWIALVINKIRSFRRKCFFGHLWKMENLTDNRGRTLRMQRRCMKCKQRQILTVKRNADGSQKLYWFYG